MKNIREKLIPLFKQGYCTPQIAVLAKKIKEPATTIHYNIKKMEEEGTIKAYKAVFNYNNINQGYCTYILINLNQEHYGNPDEVARALAKDERVESVDVCTGDYELLVKFRSKDINEYYEFIKTTVKKHGCGKVVSLASLKQFKTEFVEV
ncbi:MAG: Lrp/AsnC family transcriptional regulator [Nanoarchaeota archaeon]|nr:Lrp/AsnC family transcriptional regulator [Nanoarchaeota archaeon]